MSERLPHVTGQHSTDSKNEPRTAARTQKQRLQRMGTLILATMIVAFVVPTDSINQLLATGQKWFEACQVAGPGPFFGMMAFLPIVGFPLAPFTLAAGPLFGPTLGVGTVIICCALAVSINVTLSYWIVARLMRPMATRIVDWLGYSVPQLSDRSIWITALLIRIVPGPPFFLQNWILALIGVPFGIYLLVSTLVPLGYIASIVLFGDAIARGDPWAAAGAVGLLFVVGGVIHQMRRRWAKSSMKSS
jgi:uncharacterized membrane protein YdjX (TVP38/TMEM64 family)|uniref:TVP38/TMEM64 family protein n=1 Tax=Rheinheimera sp. TaxID=1869214 RepID=UPI0040479D53